MRMSSMVSKTQRLKVDGVESRKSLPVVRNRHLELVETGQMREAGRRTRMEVLWAVE
jgi:hypothetical protein